jgi:hypothetical protein
MLEIVNQKPSKRVGGTMQPGARHQSFLTGKLNWGDYLVPDGAYPRYSRPVPGVYHEPYSSPVKHWPVWVLAEHRDGEVWHRFIHSEQGQRGVAMGTPVGCDLLRLSGPPGMREPGGYTSPDELTGA